MSERIGVVFLSLNVGVSFDEPMRTRADVVAMVDKIRSAIAAVVPTPYDSKNHVDVEIAESAGVPADGWFASESRRAWNA